MNGSESTVVYWGWALAAGAYSLMSLRLIGQQYLGAAVNRIAVVMLAASVLTVI